MPLVRAVNGTLPPSPFFGSSVPQRWAALLLPYDDQDDDDDDDDDEKKKTPRSWVVKIIDVAHGFGLVGPTAAFGLLPTR